MTRSRCAAARAAAVLVTVALGLAGCGTVPPTSSAGDAPVTSSASTSGASTSSAPASEAPSPSSTHAASPSPTASATSSRSATPAPSASASTKAKDTPPPDTYVAHFHGREVWVPRGHGATMSFTFDDGPWPGSTSQVLALLEKHHVHAVFCLIGLQARANPSLVRKEVAGGHTLCDHSRDHDLTMGKKSKKYVYAEVSDGLADIKRAAPKGTPVTFYRQPGGFWSPTVVKAMAKDDLDPLRWDDDPKDWSRPGSTVIVQRVVKGLHPGAVILMHDGGGDRSQSVEALSFLLDAVIKAGWKPVVAPHVTYTAKQAAKPQ